MNMTTQMETTKAMAALRLGALALGALLWAGCREGGGEADEHAGHNHGPGEGHGAKAAPADPHAGHHHGPGEGHGAEPAAGDDHAGHGHATGESEGPGGVEMCGEHGVPEAECGICQPDRIVGLKPGESMKVRLPSGDSPRIAGIETTASRAGAISDGVECYAELTFNQNKLAQIAAPVGGILREVACDLGDTVAEGQAVARIWSAEIAATVARAVLSHQTLERERKLHADGIAPAKDLQEAEAGHRAACQQARALGFSEDAIDAMGRAPDEPVLLEVRAPFAGEIVERNAVRGALVEAGKPLFTVVDRSTMWAMLNIPEARLAQVQTGQTVELSIDSLPGRSVTGRLVWIAAQVDERTRMARARAEVANPDGTLRDRMFARARIVTRRTDRALLVPAGAIQRVEGAPLVFVRRADDLYDARAVRLGAQHNGQVEILAGLSADEPVVVAQAFTVKSQLLLSRLGAGCAHE
jgi:cobalt-zinc-cadmium efflux system membrane fusion protein